MSGIFLEGKQRQYCSYHPKENNCDSLCKLLNMKIEKKIQIKLDWVWHSLSSHWESLIKAVSLRLPQWSTKASIIRPPHQICPPSLSYPHGYSYIEATSIRLTCLIESASLKLSHKGRLVKIVKLRFSGCLIETTTLRLPHWGCFVKTALFWLPHS